MLTEENLDQPLIIHAGQLTTSQKLTHRLGGVLTFMAMVPQGIFGMLLLDDHWFSGDLTGNQDANYALRIALDFLFFAAALEGKRCIVRMYNTPDFKALPKTLVANVTGLKNIITCQHKYSWNDLPNFADRVATVLISGVFAGLVNLSFDGAADLMDDLNAPALMGNIFRNVWLCQSWFMAAAFACNLLAFPNIHRFGLAAFPSTKRAVFLDSETRTAEQEIAEKIEKVRLYLNYLHANNKTADINTLYTALETMAQTDIFALGASDQANVIAYYDANSAKINDDNTAPVNPSSAQHNIVRLLMLCGAAAGVIGLWNFKQMAVLTIGEWPPKVGPATIPATQWSAVLSMALMSIGSIPPAVDMIMTSLVLQKHRSVPVLSTSSFAWNMSWVVLLAVLGGSPNAYQAEKAGQALWVQGFAALASALIELTGLYAVYIGGARAKLQDDTAQKVVTLDDRLAQLRDNARAETTAQSLGSNV